MRYVPEQVSPPEKAEVMPCDYKEYPSNWKAIRAEVMARAGDKCEGTPQFPDCRVKHQTVYYYGLENKRIEHDGSHFTDQLITECNYRCSKVVLTIAHMDHDKTNNGEPGNRPNLRALCNRCHLSWDIKTHMKNARATREKKLGLQRLFT